MTTKRYETIERVYANAKPPTRLMSGTTNNVPNVERIHLDRSPVGSNVLLLGPSAYSGSIKPCHDFELAQSFEEATVVYILLTRSQANQVHRWVELDGDPPEIVVIDAVPDAGWSAGTRIDGIQLERVSSPSNLTEIGVALNQHLPATESERVVVCVRSITALLQYVDLKGAYRFLNALTNQIATSNARAHYHLDPMAHQERVVFTLLSLFDGVVEVNESDSPLRDDSTISNRTDLLRES